MQLRRAVCAGALLISLVLAAPAAAHFGGGPGGPDRHIVGRGFGGDVPSRVSDRIRRAESALRRAQDKADDGDTSGATASLAAVRRNLAAALKAAKRRVGKDNGPESLLAVTAAQHRVVDATTSLFDGLDGSLVDAVAETLDAALDGRDDAIAAIAGLSSDQEEYYRVIDRVDGDLGDEADAIEEAQSDDTLTSAAKTALKAAADQVKAAQAKVSDLADEIDADDDSDEPSGDYPDDGSSHVGAFGLGRG